MICSMLFVANVAVEQEVIAAAIMIALFYIYTLLMQDRRQKVFDRGSYVYARGLTFSKFDKTPLIYSISPLNLGAWIFVCVDKTNCSDEHQYTFSRSQVATVLHDTVFRSRSTKLRHIIKRGSCPVLERLVDVRS